MRPLSLCFLLLATGFTTASAVISVDIDLQDQKAYLLQDGRAVYETHISSGRPGHRTPTGTFKVLQKDLNHLSTLYGKIVDEDTGDVLVRDADSEMEVPEGGVFVAAPMKLLSAV